MAKKFEWSDNQKAAIEADGKNYLISAGAGSGKTAVLTERIFTLVKSGASISRFLVLTFTNAAAASMKTRIRKRLLSDPELAHLAVEIENSSIETFDAFCLFLVKKYCFDIGVTRDISPIDNSLLEIKKHTLLNDIFTELYESKDEEFKDLITRYCDKDDGVIKEIVLKISKESDLQIDKDKFFKEFVNTYFNENWLSSLVDKKFNDDIKVLNRARKLTYNLEDADDASIIQDLIDNLLSSKDYDELYFKLKNKDLYSFPKKKGKASDIEFRNYIKGVFNSIVPTEARDFGTRKEIIAAYMDNQKMVEKLLKITLELESRLDEFKKESGSYSFSDIARFALKALRKPEIQKEMRDSFDYIMVDEYQDTSDVQEEVVSLISRNNVYMVGDIKQSIYRFRNANCSIFQDKYVAYKNHEGGEEIDLNASYRSRKEIVDIVNNIFSSIMKPEYNVIDYSVGHTFEYGFKPYDDEFDKNANYNLRVINRLKTKTNAEEEAAIIAIDILNKVGRQKAFDPEIKGMRKSQFKDYAILIDRSTDFMVYKKVFNDFGIPLKIISDEPFRDSDISYVTKNLLVLFNFLKNNGETNEFDNDAKHAYMSLARSFLIDKVNDQEIYDVINNKIFLDTEIVRKIVNVVREEKFSSLFKILNVLYTQFDLYNKVIRIGNVSSNIHKAELFLELAKNLDKLSCGVEDFVTYFKDLSQFDIDIAFADEDGNADAVTLITIHKSKGLEYPFCYFPGFNKQYYNDDVKSSFLVNSKFGIILPISGDSSQASLFNSLFKEEEVRQDFEEKIRLFYVGLTRARESITIILTHKENEKPVQDFLDCKCFGDIIRFLELDIACDENRPELDPSRARVSKEKDEKIEIEMKSVSYEPELIGLVKRASKEIVEDVDDSLLEFGTRLHYLLEVSNYETKDTSYIKEKQLKKYVDNVLNCGLFDGVTNEQVLHEYSFFDEEHNTNGIIDCLVVLPDEVRIIDFKLKNISDEKYVKQLNIYADYVKLITEKSLKLYLISAITGEVKEIERT